MRTQGCDGREVWESFATFPESQQYAEGVVNKLCGDATGMVTDYCYEPFLLDPVLVNELNGVPSSIGWGWRPFVFAGSAAAGKGLASIVGPFACPGSQREDSSREWHHRLRQLSENLAGLALACQMDRSTVEG